MWRVDTLHQNKANVKEWRNFDEEHQDDNLEVDDKFHRVVEHVIIHSVYWLYRSNYLADHDHLNAID